MQMGGKEISRKLAKEKMNTGAETLEISSKYQTVEKGG